MPWRAPLTVIFHGKVIGAYQEDGEPTRM